MLNQELHEQEERLLWLKQKRDRGGCEDSDISV